MELFENAKLTSSVSESNIRYLYISYLEDNSVAPLKQITTRDCGVKF
jgi:hypothetical protein